MNTGPEKPDLYRQPWEIVEEDDIFSARPWVHVVRQHVRLPNGVEIPDFYMVESPVYTTIFAVTDEQQVVLVELYRHGVGDVVIELPAGNIEGDINEDSALAAAKRELKEETGYSAREWRYLGRYYIDSNRGMGATYAYLATGASQTTKPSPETTEIMRQRLISLEEIRKLWLDGKFSNIANAAVIGLALANLDRQ